MHFSLDHNVINKISIYLMRSCVDESAPIAIVETAFYRIACAQA